MEQFYEGQLVIDVNHKNTVEVIGSMFDGRVYCVWDDGNDEVYLTRTKNLIPYDKYWFYEEV